MPTAYDSRQSPEVNLVTLGALLEAANKAESAPDRFGITVILVQPSGVLPDFQPVAERTLYGSTEEMDAARQTESWGGYVALLSAIHGEDMTGQARAIDGQAAIDTARGYVPHMLQQVRALA